MVDRDTLMRLGQLVLIRGAQVAETTSNLFHARAEREVAARERDLRIDNRNDADSHWQSLLGSVRPDPKIVRMGGEWLLERERELHAQELDLSIAEARLGQARQDHALSLAREAAAKKISAKARNTMEKYLEERQSMQLTDSNLWRRQR
jgi:hypothetical protein